LASSSRALLPGPGPLLPQVTAEELKARQFSGQKLSRMTTAPIMRGHAPQRFHRNDFVKRQLRLRPALHFEESPDVPTRHHAGRERPDFRPAVQPVQKIAELT